MQLKFLAQYQTEVYVSDGGYIVIKQDNYPEDEQRISLSPSQARSIFENLEDLLVDAEYLFETIEGYGDE